jgi:hypothetical protein
MTAKFLARLQVTEIFRKLSQDSNEFRLFRKILKMKNEIFNFTGKSACLLKVK